MSECLCLLIPKTRTIEHGAFGVHFFLFFSSQNDSLCTSLGVFHEPFLHHRFDKDPRFSTERVLHPGEMLVVQNRRVMHARRAFKATNRYFLGCYTARDDFESRLRVLGIIPSPLLPLMENAVVVDEEK